MSRFFSYPVTMQANTESAELFLNISWIATLVAGLSFFLLGLILGWKIWGAYRGRAKLIEKANQAVLRDLEKQERSFNGHHRKYGGGNLPDEAEKKKS